MPKIDTRTSGQGRFANTAVSGILVCGFVLLAWLIVTMAAADRYAQSNPERALLWVSEDPKALIELAEKKLNAENPSDAELAAAERLARVALEETPLAARAIRVFGLVAEKRGREAEALSLMKSAGQLALRDRGTQVWLAVRMLTAGQVDDALYRMDAVLRAHVGFRGRLLPTLIAIASDAKLAPNVARLIQTDPPWRRGFLKQFVATSNDPVAIEPLRQALRDRSILLDDEERQAYIQRLVSAGMFAQARSVWRESVEAGDATGATGDDTVSNGGFEQPPTGLQFDWVVTPLPGVAVATEVPPGNEDGNQALKVEFTGNRVQFRHVTQLMTLSPGSYRLQLRARADDLRNDRGLWWTISCAPKGKPSLGSTQLLKGTTSWIDQTLDFIVPEGCGAQWLRLELPARVAIEQEARGRVWYDDVRVTRRRDL